MNYNKLPPPAAKVFIGRQPFYYTKKSGLSSRHRGAKKNEKRMKKGTGGESRYTAGAEK
ncbi:MAG: hypothetical protein PUI75_08345 [Subdoligranulum sp.]|nr:hypothetical protein [Subdoligranulum sp.]MDY6125845.1 hypothetical protein [Gemmiger qucibialis]